MKKIERIVKQILEAESEKSLGKNVKENEAKIENIMCRLTIEEMFALDECIQKQNKNY